MIEPVENTDLIEECHKIYKVNLINILLKLQKGWVRLQKTCASNGTTSSPMLLELSLISVQMEISSMSPLVVLTAPEDSQFRYYN